MMDHKPETQKMTTYLPGSPTSETQRLAPPTRPGCSWLVVMAAVAASLSGLMLGYEMGLTSGVLLQLRGVLSLSCREQELLVGSHLLGALLICLAGGPILDHYGRRCSLLLSAALVVGGTVVLVAVTSLAALTLGRLIVGMGTALSGTAACLYIAEISPRERRGLLVTLYELMLVVGVMLGFGCSYAFASLPRGWTYTFGLVVPPALLQIGALLFLPLSPRFLVAQGRVEQAKVVLARLRGGVSDQVEAELRDIQVGLKEESEHSFWELFSSKANLRLRLLTGIALVFLQQATGQPNILSYASPLLRSVGFNSDAAATLASTGFGVVKVVFTVPAVLLVDRVGPKSFLCVGAVAMGMSLATLGTLTLQSHTHLTSLCKSHTHLNHTHLLWDLNRTVLDQNDLDLYSTQLPPEWISEEVARAEDQSGGRTHMEVSSSLKWASLISLLLYVAAFSISLGPMVYVVLSEIFPMGVRGRAVSVVSAVNWATNLLISMTFLTITEKIGVPNIMFLYAAMSFVLLVFVILCVPETKGRTLEEISKELAKKKNFQLRICRKVQPKESLIRIKSPAVV
ncbi:solute carrier family 2, facilitated glucose transporter member 12 [Acanthochromis polyacanthus]|uniref:Solute carrier family 2, facilitated glucose transporter member 10 n=1 Tax=Acanthochromis polyacanthus TaxID=80966 RepID=A0A3Q1FSN6_9TELE|nr:solute carrier family 2, facilitated glucose transporter member 12 [Acanthochromis polyacanthus]XP_022076884.1 solute carrier family 2, facilitated glucose transporter member 12 [Acanthochromis polyacanthus]XP_051792911.1 solute carrier family 2, facilitated glucose transporter member 12 [Acanthochromis polyacanthus]XP_051792912.1 solute carrier family 2, facilitated glucose transporter member 12 [Acanthochromis polyacanthus]XP_051792913.1 solute carrier family 2, facilitated glucose transpo